VGGGVRAPHTGLAWPKARGKGDPGGGARYQPGQRRDAECVNESGWRGSLANKTGVMGGSRTYYKGLRETIRGGKKESRVLMSYLPRRPRYLKTYRLSRGNLTTTLEKKMKGREDTVEQIKKKKRKGSRMTPDVFFAKPSNTAGGKKGPFPQSYLGGTLPTQRRPIVR